MRSRPMYYKLIGRLPVPMSDLTEFGKWFETTDRTVSIDRIGPVTVSTVFLGVDHNFSPDPESHPRLFETMIFKDGDDGREDAVYDRYETWDDAEKGHAKAVEITKSALLALERKGCQ